MSISEQHHQPDGNASLRSIGPYPENGSERQTIAAALGDVEDRITYLTD